VFFKLNVGVYKPKSIGFSLIIINSNYEIISIDINIIRIFFKKGKIFKFHLFSNQVEHVQQAENIILLPLSQAMFDDSLINAHGVITGAGFETPAEALYLGKQLMVLPMHGQYEQACNAAALKEFNVAVVDAIDDYFPVYFNKWIFDGRQSLGFSLSTPVEKIVESVVHGQVSTFVKSPLDLITSA
jgi:uncharacterized protein (TIGR00661 family)